MLPVCLSVHKASVKQVWPMVRYGVIDDVFGCGSFFEFRLLEMDLCVESGGGE